MDPQPSQQQAGLQHVVWWLQKEVTRPKARSKTYFGGGWGSNQVPTYLHLYPPRYRPGLLCASIFINVILEVVYIKFPFCFCFPCGKLFHSFVSFCAINWIMTFALTDVYVYSFTRSFFCLKIVTRYSWPLFIYFQYILSKQNGVSKLTTGQKKFLPAPV